MNGFLSILYILGLFPAFAAGSMLLRDRDSFPQSTSRKSNFPKVTFFLVLIIGIPSILQFFFPTMLPTFQRDYESFLHGDRWRIITPLFVQDGGVIGTIFNLICLALLGGVVERIWNGTIMLIIFFMGGITGEIAGFAWQPIGAGNSVGNFSLAASIAVVSLMRFPSKPVRILAVVALGANGILLWLRDIHGAAALMGAILALILSQIWHEKRQN
jgi:membrane associated rhomboid family serine protease